MPFVGIFSRAYAGPFEPDLCAQFGEGRVVCYRWHTSMPRGPVWVILAFTGKPLVMHKCNGAPEGPVTTDYNLTRHKPDSCSRSFRHPIPPQHPVTLPTQSLAFVPLNTSSCPPSLNLLLLCPPLLFQHCPLPLPLIPVSTTSEGRTI